MFVFFWKKEIGKKAACKMLVEIDCSSTLSGGDIFESRDSSYSPLERDIAKVQVYFKTATVIQVSISPTFYAQLF